MVGDGIVTLAVWLVTDFRNSKSRVWMGRERLHLVDHPHDRRRVVDIPVGLVKLDRHAALLHHAVELRQEVDVEKGAAEFPVGDAAQAQVLLQVHDLADRAVLDLAQRRGRDRAAVEIIARLEQVFRPQKTADVIGTERLAARRRRRELEHSSNDLRIGNRVCRVHSSATRGFWRAAWLAGVGR